MTNKVYQGDLPDNLILGSVIAVDCETMGLNPNRDRLCVIQLSAGDGHAHLVQISQGQVEAPNLCKVLEDRKILKIFHFGRFDIAALFKTFGVLTTNVYCTKIASRLIRTYTDKHGLKNLLQELLAIDISKQQQSSDWGSKILSKAQIEYAASDVLYLHKLRDILTQKLEREDRMGVAQSCFDFLPIRAKLDIQGWPDADIFSHS